MDLRKSAIYYIQENVLGRAEKLLQKWVLEHPDDTYAHMELIWCFYKRSADFNRWSDCNHFYEQVYNKINAQVMRRFVRAEELFYENNMEESLLHYKAAIDAGLDVPALHHSLATVLKVLGRNEEAKEAYEVALTQEPHFLPTLSAYGCMLFQEGRFDLLKQILQPLEERDSLSFEYQFKNALEDIAELMSLKEACSVLENSIALFHKDKICDSIINLWPVFLKQKDNCWFVRTIVYLFYRADWLLFGKEKLEEVLDSESPIMLYGCGLVQWYQDKKEEALKNYNEAIEKGLDHHLVCCARALVYEALKKDEEREQDLLAAFSYAPWCIYVKEDLTRLRYKQGKLCEVDCLACVTPTEYKCAAAYDVSGIYSLSRLEELALSSLLQQGRAKEALGRIREQCMTYEDEDFRFRKAMVFAENEEFNEAVLELTESVKLDFQVIGTTDKTDKMRLMSILDHESDSFGVAFVKALLPAFEDQLEETKKKLERLIKDFPNEPDAWYHLANVSFILKDPVSAMKACSKALDLDHNCKKALLLLCRILLDDGDVPALRKISEKLSGATEPLLYALEWAKNNKKPQMVKQIASELLTIDPNNENAVSCLLEDLDHESLEFAQMGKRLTISNPLNFENRSYIAHTFLMNGEFREAMRIYDSLYEDGFYSVYNILMQGLAYCAVQDSQEHTS